MCGGRNEPTPTAKGMDFCWLAPLFTPMLLGNLNIFLHPFFDPHVHSLQGEKNHGFEVLYHSVKQGPISTKELADFIRER